MGDSNKKGGGLFDGLSGLGKKLGGMFYEGGEQAAEQSTGRPVSPIETRPLPPVSLPTVTPSLISTVPVNAEQLNVATDAAVKEMRKFGGPLTDFLKSVEELKDEIPTEESRFRVVVKTRHINPTDLLRAAKEQKTALDQLREKFAGEVEGLSKEATNLCQQATSIESQIKSLTDQIETLRGQQAKITEEAAKKKNNIEAGRSTFEQAYVAANEMLEKDVKKVTDYLNLNEKKGE